MNLSYIDKDKAKTFSQWLSAFFCCFWLISSLITIVHEQEHAVIEEHNCPLCLVNENTSAKNNVNLLLLSPILLISFISKYKSPCSTTVFQLFLGSRDPPYHC